MNYLSKISPYSFPGIKKINLKNKPKLFNLEIELNTFLKHFSFTKENFYGKSRKKNIVKWRFMFWLYLYEERKISYSKLGSIFNRNHTSILYGVKSIKNRTLLESDILKEYHDLKLKLLLILLQH